MVINSNQTIQIKPAPLFRRLAAAFYDGFVLFSFIVLATAIALLINQGHSFLPIQTFFLSYLFAVTGIFLGWFWHRGQTLGMLAWKLQLVDNHDQQVSWSKAWLRYLLAYFSVGLCGIGWLWCLVDKNKQSLHDCLAGTKMVMR